MPIDNLSNLLGIGLAYVKKDNTWYLGENSSGVYMPDVLSPYAGSVGSNIDDGFDVAGPNYKKGYRLYGEDNSFNLNGKYTTIKGLVGFIRNENWVNYSASISFYGDGKLLKSISLNWDDLPKELNISVKGVKKFEIKTDGDRTDEIAIVNPRIY